MADVELPVRSTRSSVRKSVRFAPEAEGRAPTAPLRVTRKAGPPVAADPPGAGGAEIIEEEHA